MKRALILTIFVVVAFVASAQDKTKSTTPAETPATPVVVAPATPATALGAESTSLLRTHRHPYHPH